MGMMIQAGRFGGGNAALQLLQSATLFLDASNSAAGEPRAINQGTGGTALNATYGSVLGSYIYNGAAVLPGLSGNWLSVPDAANLDGFAVIDLIAQVSLTDWTPTAESTLIGKWSGGTQKSYVLVVTTSGALRLYLSEDGAAATTTTTVSLGLTDGAVSYVRAVIRAGSPNGTVDFYTSTNGSAWVAVGVQQSITGYDTTVFAGTARLGIGAYEEAGSGTPMTGSVYSAQVWNGDSTSGGTKVLDVNLAAVPNYATSFICTTGQTVTVNSTSADSNDPLLLGHAGTNYLYFPGVLANYASAPDSAALDLTGDVELVIRLSMPDWTPAANARLISKRDSAAVGNYELLITTAGALSYCNAAGGGTATNSTAAVPFSDGAAGWLKVTYRHSDLRLQFFTAADAASEPGAWTQLGTDVTHGAAGNTANTATLCIGGIGTSFDPLNGSVYRAIVRNGIAGSTVFDANFTTVTNHSSFSESSSNAATVTVNRSTSGRKTVLVTRQILLFGTDDFLNVADNALLNFGAAESFTVLAIARGWATPANNGAFVFKGNGGSADHYGIIWNGATFNSLASIGDGAIQVTDVGALVAAGSLNLFGQVRDVGLDTVAAYVNNSAPSPTADSTTAGLENASPLTIGRLNGSFYNDMELAAVAVFRRALTPAEIATICTYFGTT